jgi:sugar/nucleoside kinase (ribokinase family)
MSTKLFDLMTVGNFSMDCIKLPTEPNPRAVLGGAVAYVSLVTRQLGATSAIISKVGSDFPEAYVRRLQKEGVDLSGVAMDNSRKTTSFELKYNEDLSSRTLRLKNKGSQITLADLPKSLKAKVIHLAPIAAEISYEVVEQMKSRGDCLSIDPQGMTRRFDKNGNVTCCSQMDKRILPLVNIYKSSQDEVAILTGLTDFKKASKAIHDLGPEIVIATMGSHGAILSVQGVVYNVSAYKSTHVIDPTGAGDAFIGAFLNEYIRREDPLWCSCVGSAAASLVVEGVGSEFFGEKAEIYRRAKLVYEIDSNK